MKSIKMLLAVLVSLFAFQATAQQIQFRQYTDGTCAIAGQEVNDVAVCRSFVANSQTGGQGGQQVASAPSGVNPAIVAACAGAGGLIAHAVTHGNKHRMVFTIGGAALAGYACYEMQKPNGGQGVGAVASGMMGAVGPMIYGGNVGMTPVQYEAHKASLIAGYRSDMAYGCQNRLRAMNGGRPLTVDQVNSCAM